MKKIFIILLCIVFILSAFASCDQAEENKTEISESVSETVSEALPEQSEEVSDVSAEVSELTFIIVDKRDTVGIFDDALETFFSDEEYEYVFPSTPESKYIIVEYSDGTTQNIKEALADGKVTIEDFNKSNIFYFKQSKATGEYEPVNRK